METARSRKSRPALTVRVALLADPVHSAVGVDAQEEAPVFAVQPLGVLEVAGREGAAAAVLRQGGQRGDAPGCHGPDSALPGSPSPWSRAGSRRAPAPASDALRGAAPAPAPQPPSTRHAAAPAGPQPQAVPPLPSPPALEHGEPSGPGAGSKGWVSPQPPLSGGPPPEAAAPGILLQPRAQRPLVWQQPGRGVTSSTSPPANAHQPRRSPVLLPSCAPPPTRSAFYGTGLRVGRSGRNTQARDLRARRGGGRSPNAVRGRGRCGDAAGGHGPGLRRSGGSTPPVPPEGAQPNPAQPKSHSDFLHTVELLLCNQP